MVQTPSRAVRRALIGLFALAILYLAVGFFVMLTATRPHRRLNPAVSPAAIGLPFEEVMFPARGGDAQLSGWFIPEPSKSRAVILVHGKDSNRTRMLYGHAPDVAAALRQHGMAVLMFDLRGHGTSPQARFTLGIHEARDVLGAVDFLLARGFAPGRIGVFGQSMGAAATVFAAADEPAIAAVITDCGFADIGPIMEREWKRTTGLPNLFMPATRVASRLLLGFDMGMSRPVAAIGRIAPRPMLIIHSQEDTLVPAADAMMLKGAMPGAELWIIPGIDHVEGYKQNPLEFTHRIGEFFDRHLPK
jgi:fermentation-respiration switch protein FrsA (DUF1100 family)